MTSQHGPTVQQPDNTTLRSSGSGQLPISKKLSTDAKQAIILPNLKNLSLISLGQLCDDGCKIALHPKRLLVRKNNNIILCGIGNCQDGLWDIPIAKIELHTANFVIPSTHAALYTSQNRDHTSIARVRRTKKKYPNTNCALLHTLII